MEHVTHNKVMVFGTFDIIHRGHENFFKQARKFGNFLIAVIARDKTVLEIKGCLPRNNEKERLNNLKNNNLINKAILGGLKDKYEIIKKFRPNVICLGYDQKAFTEGLKKAPLLKSLSRACRGKGGGGKKIKIVRLKPYKPEIYKSSKINNSSPC